MEIYFKIDFVIALKKIKGYESPSDQNGEFLQLANRIKKHAARGGGAPWS